MKQGLTEDTKDLLIIGSLFAAFIGAMGTAVYSKSQSQDQEVQTQSFLACVNTARPESKMVLQVEVAANAPVSQAAANYITNKFDAVAVRFSPEQITNNIFPVKTQMSLTAMKMQRDDNLLVRARPVRLSQDCS